MENAEERKKMKKIEKEEQLKKKLEQNDGRKKWLRIRKRWKGNRQL